MVISLNLGHAAKRNAALAALTVRRAADLHSGLNLIERSSKA